MDIEYNQWLIQKILEYVGDYRRSGTEYNFRCPICGDSQSNKMKRRGYLGVNKQGNVDYYCHNCNTGKSGINLLKFLSGDDFSTLKVEYFHYKYGSSSPALSASFDYGVKTKTDTLKDVMSKNIIKPEWKHPLSDKAIEYLTNRKVLEAPFLKEKLFSYINEKNGNEFIMIPWIINGVSSYFQLNDFLKVDKLGRKYIFPKNHEKMIYGLDNIDISWPYIIVQEGVYDSLFLPNCIAVGGKTLTENQYRIIKDRYPRHQIVIGFDNDKPGLKVVQKLIETDHRRFKFLKWFDEKTQQKDINDYVLFKDDVNIFTNKSTVEKFIVDPLKMKLYLMKNNMWE